MLEAKFSAGGSLQFFAGGLALVTVNAALYFFGPSYFPMLWILGGMLALIGLRGIDRRVMLRIGPEGLLYAPWSPQAISWGEFESFCVFEQKRYRFIEAQVKYPEQFRQRLRAFRRLETWLNQRVGRPPYFINPTQLDAGVDEIVAALEFNGAKVR